MFIYASCIKYISICIFHKFPLKRFTSGFFFLARKRNIAKRTSLLSGYDTYTLTHSHTHSVDASNSPTPPAWRSPAALSAATCSVEIRSSCFSSRIHTLYPVAPKLWMWVQQGGKNGSSLAEWRSRTADAAKDDQPELFKVIFLQPNQTSSTETRPVYPLAPQGHACLERSATHVNGASIRGCGYFLQCSCRKRKKSSACRSPLGWCAHYAGEAAHNVRKGVPNYALLLARKRRVYWVTGYGCYRGGGGGVNQSPKRSVYKILQRQLHYAQRVHTKWISVQSNLSYGPKTKTSKVSLSFHWIPPPSPSLHVPPPPRCCLPFLWNAYSVPTRSWLPTFFNQRRKPQTSDNQPEAFHETTLCETRDGLNSKLSSLVKGDLHQLNRRMVHHQ